MKLRAFAFHDAARGDLIDIWRLVARNDGAERADAVLGRVEAFCRSLGEFAEVGTRHDQIKSGLRSVGVPGLRSVTLLFVVGASSVTVLRIGYLGRNVWEKVPG